MLSDDALIRFFLSVMFGFPSGPCQEGYYCPVGSSSRTQVICTVGNYCPTTSDIPTACPEGTFNPYEGRMNESQCTPCTEGSYCQTQGEFESRPSCGEYRPVSLTCFCFLRLFTCLYALECRQALVGRVFTAGTGACT